VFGGFEDAIAEEYARLVAESAAAAEAARVSPAGGDGAPGPDAAPPRTIGTYRLLHEIGRGGQAVVYLAEDTRLKRRVALKVFAPGLLASENLVARFRREAEAASRLDHPGICTVFEAGIDGETPYIAMRHIEGRSLAEWIESSRAQQGEHRRTSSLELPAPPGAAAGTKPSLTMRIVLLIE
jgi:serine/threonine protein kinase